MDVGPLSFHFLNTCPVPHVVLAKLSNAEFTATGFVSTGKRRVRQQKTAHLKQNKEEINKEIFVITVTEHVCAQAKSLEGCFYGVTIRLTGYDKVQVGRFAVSLVGRLKLFANKLGAATNAQKAGA